METSTLKEQLHQLIEGTHDSEVLEKCLVILRKHRTSLQPKASKQTEQDEPSGEADMERIKKLVNWPTKK